MRAPDDFPEASVGEVKSSADDVPRPSSSSPADGDGANDINHSFLPPPPSSNTIERRTPPVYRYADATAAVTATATPPRPPMPPSTSRQSYYNPGYYAYGGHHQYYHHAGYNYGHRHPAGYHPTTDNRKDASTAAATTSDAADPTPITPRDDDHSPPGVTMSPTPPAQPQRRDDTGSNTAPSTPPPAVPSSEIIPDSDISDKDVLSGRGGGTNNHPGNKEFRSLVDQYRSEYVLSKKWAKREIARNIVASIRSNGGRFLKKEGYGWRDIGDQKAGEKTSQALREGLAAKMRAAYAESSGTSASHQASASRRPPSAPAPAGEPSSSSAHLQGAEYYHIPPHNYQYYSPDSVSGQVHPRSSDPTSACAYEPYDYTPYEYSPEAYMRGPPLLSSPVKRRRLAYSTAEPSQAEPV